MKNRQGGTDWGRAEASYEETGREGQTGARWYSDG